MQFTRENVEKVMAGTKTQTRRVVKEGEYLIDFGVRNEVVWGYAGPTGTVIIKTKWAEDNTYAVCPGRGKSSIGRIRLLSIRKEKLQDISEADCAAELGCLVEWPGPGPEPYKRNLRAAYAELWDSINPKGHKFADNDDVWALTFEVVQ